MTNHKEGKEKKGGLKEKPNPDEIGKIPGPQGQAPGEIQRPIPLCYRCEHRARYLEQGDMPRAECGQIDKAVATCYDYHPVRPVTVVPRDGEDRPAFAPWMFAGRVKGIRIAEGQYELYEKDGQLTLYFVPVGE